MSHVTQSIGFLKCGHDDNKTETIAYQMRCYIMLSDHPCVGYMIFVVFSGQSFVLPYGFHHELTWYAQFMALRSWR